MFTIIHCHYLLEDLKLFELYADSKQWHYNRRQTNQFYAAKFSSALYHVQRRKACIFGGKTSHTIRYGTKQYDQPPTL
jgi:hypothetical protein